MKRKFMTCGLIGGVCLLAGVAAAGSGTVNKSDNKRNETVSVVSYKNMEDKGKSDKSAVQLLPPCLVEHTIVSPAYPIPGSSFIFTDKITTFPC